MPNCNIESSMGLLTILFSFWMILWCIQNAPSLQKWAKIIGGLIILKVVVTMVMSMCCGSGKPGCPLHKGMQGPNMMHHGQMPTTPQAPGVPAPAPNGN